MSWIANLQKAIKSPGKIITGLRFRLAERYVAFDNAFKRSRRGPASADSKELTEINARAMTRSDISDHLPVMFLEAIVVKPKLIVELGVRGGESTFVFERVARLTGATLVSVDVEDCSRASDYEKWHFVQSDDVAFASRFRDWCEGKGIVPRIDVLFIDTSHLYEHTLAEIKSWLPHCSEQAKVLLHDTNMREIYRRNDGSRGHGWDSDRGVITAIEDYLDTRFQESTNFIAHQKGWWIDHRANCNGLTILHRVPLS